VLQPQNMKKETSPTRLEGFRAPNSDPKISDVCLLCPPTAYESTSQSTPQITPTVSEVVTFHPPWECMGLCTVPSAVPLCQPRIVALSYPGLTYGHLCNTSPTATNLVAQVAFSENLSHRARQRNRAPAKTSTSGSAFSWRLQNFCGTPTGAASGHALLADSKGNDTSKS
jgi:hypothetical protein